MRPVVCNKTRKRGVQIEREIILNKRAFVPSYHALSHRLAFPIERGFVSQGPFRVQHPFDLRGALSDKKSQRRTQGEPLPNELTPQMTPCTKILCSYKAIRAPVVLPSTPIKLEMRGGKAHPVSQELTEGT